MPTMKSTSALILTLTVLLVLFRQLNAPYPCLKILYANARSILPKIDELRTRKVMFLVGYQSLSWNNLSLIPTTFEIHVDVSTAMLQPLFVLMKAATWQLKRQHEFQKWLELRTNYSRIELRTVACCDPPDIVCAVETWLLRR